MEEARDDASIELQKERKEKRAFDFMKQVWGVQWVHGNFAF